MPDARAPWPTHQDIFLILHDLRSSLDTLDLDEIDGEFYWLYCRADLLEPIRDFRALRACFADPLPDCKFPAAQVFYLRSAMRWALQAHQVFDDLFDSYPMPIFERLFGCARVPVRVPEVLRHWEDEGSVYRVRIYSGTTTGVDVEEAFDEHLRAFGGSEWGFTFNVELGVFEPDEIRRDACGRILERRADDPNTVCLSKYIEFHLVPGPEFLAEQAPIRFPCVEVVIHPPAPPPGTIARDYDQVVREEKQWHLTLPGGGTTQEKEVALRTWSVGLLMRSGIGFNAAMRHVCQFLDIPEVSQACFTSDRRRLLDRVPEAGPFLYARKNSPAALAKAKKSASPLQP